MPGIPGIPGIVLGRDRELAVIREFIDEAAGSGAALLLSAEWGLGKTVLLQAAIDAAASAGVRVLAASAVESETSIDYATLDQLVRQLGQDHDDVGTADHGTLAAVTASGGAAVADAVLAAASRVTAAGPTVFVVDDLQWADRSSALVLGTLARNAIAGGYGFLASFRPAADSHFDVSGLPELRLPPLGAGAAVSLLTRRFPMLPVRALRRVLDEAQGNPLALLELAIALRGTGRRADMTVPDLLPVSHRLQSVFGPLIAQLPADTRQLLLLAALEGDGDLRLILSAAQGEGAPDALEAAERLRLVMIDRDAQRVVFRHPVARLTVVALASSTDRRAAHGRLAQALADHPERQAWHLAEATIDPDEEIAALVEKAASQVLRRGDAGQAVAALVHSAGLSPHRQARASRLAAAAYAGALAGGDLRRVRVLLGEASRAVPGPAASLHQTVASSYALLHGEGALGDAHRLLAPPALAHSADSTNGAFIEALHTLFDVCSHGGRAELWEPLDAALSRLSSQIPSVLRLRVSVAGDPASVGRADLDLLDSAIAALGDETDPTLVVRLATAALHADRAGSCRDALWRVVNSGRAGGAVTSAIAAMAVLGLDHYWSGRWDESERLGREGVQLADRHGYRLLAAQLKSGMMLIAASRGQADRVRALSGEVNGWAAPRGLRAIQFGCGHARALAAIGQGDFEEAYQQASAISPAGALSARVPPALLTAWDLVESAVRTGRRCEAAAHVRAMKAAHLEELSPRFALLTAGAAGITATGDAAVDAFEHALSIAGAEQWPFDLARVQLAYGECLRRTRATADSRGQLAAALARFERLGARPWARRAASELRATHPQRQSPFGYDPGSLTPQQREVASLAASGLSNKQIANRLFMSHRTVEAHLRQIFPKLGIGSRAALRDALTSVRAPR